MTTTRHQCPTCSAIVTTTYDRTDPDFHDIDAAPVCNATDACGFIWSDPLPANPAPAKRAVKFHLIGEAADYVPGDDRPYDVAVRGVTVGVAEKTWVLGAREGEGFWGWMVNIDGVGYGEGRTRYDAVRDAYAG